MTTEDILKAAYDAETFRQMGHNLIDRLANQLEAVQGGEGKAIPYFSPQDSWERWKDDSEQKGKDPLELLAIAIEEGVQLHHPGYMGHQISPPVPIAALAGLVNDFMNNGMGVYEMGTVGVTLEKLVCGIVARHLGFSDQADGILTSGGTLANLTALLTARRVKAPEDVWQLGHTTRLALMVSEQAHYCVDRAVRIMGWGSAGIIKVPTDDHYRIRVDLLPDYLERAQHSGWTVIAVVGSACSTATGAFDDLHGLADFCAAHNLWLHVDGAHGAATAFSPKYAHLVSGIERADSVAMDFHKMLITPALATALIYKQGDEAYRTFSQEAAYLWEQGEEREWYNLAKRTFECTKAMYSLKFYSTYRVYGSSLFEAYISTVIDTTMVFAEQISSHPDFELAVQPECNIICFRHLPPEVPRTSTAHLNEWNSRLRKAMLREGRFYIVQTQLKEKLFLRCTLTNPFTTEEGTRQLLEELLEQVHKLKVSFTF